MQWFGKSLGLFGNRDRDKSCYRIFVELLKATKRDDPLSSDAIGFRLSLSRGTVMHHINVLMDRGLVITRRNAYLLRTDTLDALLSEVERDFQAHMTKMREAAREMDKKLEGADS